jgi:ABC-2 type transport system ATP-binding protein
MSEPIVVAERLSKRFGDVVAVNDVSFEVSAGQVYGLLGPNGAGKTTILRMLTGLERPTAGTMSLFGTTVAPGCGELLRVGAMVEQAAFVPHLSGMRNLQLWWQAGGARMRDADLEGALAIAGLGDAIDRKVKTYSQGMKQRLGFARLLLASPELLVLDEPTNGLDPAEIREIRELIGRLSAAGATVLLSSHHLSEVEQVCSHAIVIDHGEVVADGTVQELIGASGAVYLEVDDRHRAIEVLATLPHVSHVQPQGDGLVFDLGDGRRSDIAAAITAAGLRLETLMPTQQLEHAFLDLLAGNNSTQNLSSANTGVAS